MRKLLLAISVLCLLSGASVPVGASPGAGVGVVQDALAIWVEMDGATGKLYGAMGWRTINPDGSLSTSAVVMKGTCTRRRSGRMVMVSCSGRGVGKEIPMGDFELDPLLGSASLRVKTGGISHDVSWRGRGRTPQSAGGAGGDDSYFEAGAGMYRDARSTGRVFGKKLASRGWSDWSELSQGAGVAGWSEAPAAAPEVTLLSDGTVTVAHSFPVSARR